MTTDRNAEHFTTALKHLLILVLLVAGLSSCGITTGDPGAAASSSSQDTAMIYASYFPTLAYLAPNQLEEKLGVPLEDLTGNPEAAAEAVVSSGATRATAGVDTTVSISGSTVVGVRAAWVKPIVAPFAAIRAAIERGDLGSVPAIPGLDFTVRQVATGLECRATSAPWLHVTRTEIPPAPARSNNDSKDAYRALVTQWLREVSANEATVLDQLSAWVGGVPRHSGTSDPLCYLDEERARQLTAEVEHPETTIVTDYLAVGTLDEVTDLEGLRVNLVVVCDAGGASSEDARNCDDTRMTAAQDLTDLNATVIPVDAGTLFEAAPTGDHPDRNLLTAQFSQLNEEELNDLLADPINNTFEGGF